jgi:Plasmid stabilization system protein
MAYRVAWSPRAVEDLDSIAQYIAVDSTSYAAAIVKTILNTTRNLDQFPYSGRVVPEIGDESIRLMEHVRNLSRLALLD